MPEPSQEEQDYRARIVAQHEEMNLRMSKNHFWQFNVGHAITVIVMIGGWLWYISKAENRITNLETAQARLTILLEKIDEHGTAASQRGIFQESELAKSNEHRISMLESVWRELSPKVERIDNNLLWLMKEQPNAPR